MSKRLIEILIYKCFGNFRLPLDPSIKLSTALCNISYENCIENFGKRADLFMKCNGISGVTSLEFLSRGHYR